MGEVPGEEKKKRGTELRSFPPDDIKCGVTMAFDLPTDVMLKLVGEESLGRLHTLRAVSRHFERAASRAMGARCLSLSVRGATDELELLTLVTRLVSLRQLDISEAGEGAVQVVCNALQ